MRGRGGWDGSALGYVRATIVLPVGIALLTLSVVGSFVARRRPSAITGILAVSWLLAVTLMTISIVWYARMADPH